MALIGFGWFDSGLHVMTIYLDWAKCCFYERHELLLLPEAA